MQGELGMIQRTLRNVIEHKKRIMHLIIVSFVISILECYIVLRIIFPYKPFTNFHYTKFIYLFSSYLVSMHLFLAFFIHP